MPNFRLDGKTVLITGSTSGLGRTIGVELGKIGAKVAMNYAHNTERAEQSFAAYLATGATGILVQGSAIDPNQVNLMVDEVEEKLGQIDILIVNATPVQSFAPLEQTDWSDYQTMLDFFIKSPYLLARRVIPSMKARQRGRIINIGTELLARSVPHTSAYATAKAGQHGWTRSMAVELAPHGITINTISPGWIPVERHANAPEEIKAAYLQSIPMGRWGIPEDLVGAIAYLASDASDFLTGQHLYLNGGRAM